MQLNLWDDRPTADKVLAIFTPEDAFLTRTQIAGRMGIKKTRLLIATLEQMCLEGVLRRESVLLSNGVQAYAYERL